jgi:OmpA-OmpF porin, OOP family
MEQLQTSFQRGQKGMPNTIVDTIFGLVSPQVTNTLATRLGGTAVTVQSGLETGIAALLGGIASHADDSGFMGRVFNLANSSNTQNIFNSLTNLALGVSASHAGEQGMKLTSLLFGNQQAGVESLVGRQSGLGSAAGSDLMAVAAPLTLGFLGQQIRERALTPSSFAGLISFEASKLQHLLPPSLSSLISSASIPSDVSNAFDSPSESGGKKGIVILIALLVLALIGWLLARGCNKSQPTPAATEQQAAPAPAPAAGPLGEFIQRKLPDGTVLNIPRLGIENKLIDFIEDSSKPVDKTTWFDFDRLTFDTGKATLQSSSSEQLQNIAAILKAYPNVKAKIGGYTDNTGNQQANLKLSQDRATNVMHDLVQRGIDSSRLEAKGYGEEYPVADNATEEGRQKNRRISLLVTAK